jgi:hypothetical protein
LSEERRLPPAQHIGTHPCRSIDIALDSFNRQIHATWQYEDKVEMLLSLDIMAAFNRVVPEQLLHSMRERKTHE